MLVYLITNLMYYGTLTVKIISILLSLRNTLIYIITIPIIMYLIIGKLNHSQLVVCIAILLTFLIVLHHHSTVDLNRSNIVALLKVLFDLR